MGDFASCSPLSDSHLCFYLVIIKDLFASFLCSFQNAKMLTVHVKNAKYTPLQITFLNANLTSKDVINSLGIRANTHKTNGTAAWMNTCPISPNQV